MKNKICNCKVPNIDMDTFNCIDCRGKVKNIPVIKPSEIEDEEIDDILLEEGYDEDDDDF